MDKSYVLACDLGTGGCKSSLFDEQGFCLDELFIEYPTYYPSVGMHEQRPLDWLFAVKESLKQLVGKQPDAVVSSIKGLGVSGHSLGMVPIDSEGTVLLKQVPIWSDSRPGPDELDSFFSAIPGEEWYLVTGNGFPPQLYTVFKILWMKHHQPEVFSRTSVVIGTKDFINYKFTGKILTDYSYASGTGVYDLKGWGYSERLIQAAGLDPSIFPEIVKSSDIVGTILPELANELGLPRHLAIVAGGVDNSCMALGAGCYKEGTIYNSLGSSSWIATSSEQPVLDIDKRPYVFTHVVPGQFASATAIFSAGSSYKWLAAMLYEKEGKIDYSELEQLATAVPPGADSLVFNPTLAGGSSLDKSPLAKGGFAGLTLNHTKGHIVRAVLEGVACGLRTALDVLRSMVEVNDQMVVVGGGSKSSLWCQILSDVLQVDVIKTSIDQQTAALGAAALVCKGCGIWEDFSPLDDLAEVRARFQPDPDLIRVYANLLEDYREFSEYLSDYGMKEARR